MKMAYFAGGCFWCIEPTFVRLDGVTDVNCGYAGGKEENPTYEEVKAQKTSHRETICIRYQPEKISYEKLLEVFLYNVDPFDQGGQFIDRGFSYTLAVFYQSEEEKECAERLLSDLEQESGKKVFVSVLPFTTYYEAEEYHQDYYRKNPLEFAREMVLSGRRKKEES